MSITLFDGKRKRTIELNNVGICHYVWVRGAFEGLGSCLQPNIRGLIIVTSKQCHRRDQIRLEGDVELKSNNTE